MRYGVMADVHGNQQALRAVLAALAELNVDRCLVAGDLVGYGPNPNECIEMLADAEALCIAGSHDLMVLGQLPESRHTGLVWTSLVWTRENLRPESVAFLGDLPRVLRLEDEIGMAHGALDDPQVYVSTSAEAAVQLRALAEIEPSPSFLVLGHTHRPALFSALGPASTSPRREIELVQDRSWLLNPGSVGQSRIRSAAARFAVLDTSARTIVFHVVPYDVDSCAAALHTAGLDPRSYHLRPSLARVAARTLRRRTAGAVSRKTRK